MTRRARSVAARSRGDELEDPFRVRVEQFAKYHGWLVYHTHDSRRSAAGFPDDVMVRGPELLIAEFKTRTGRLRPAQEQWLEALGVVADAAHAVQAVDGWNEHPPVIDVYVWRPADWEAGDIQRRLARSTDAG